MTKVLKFKYGSYAATVSYTVTGRGASTEWWFSTLAGDRISLIGHGDLSLYGYTDVGVERRIAAIAKDLVDVASSVWGGTFLYAGAVRETTEAHARAHMDIWEDDLSWTSEFGRTIAFYELLAQFKLTNPAVIIASQLGVESVRTVHDRIARARKDGLLESYGQGKSHE